MFMARPWEIRRSRPSNVHPQHQLKPIDSWQINSHRNRRSTASAWRSRSLSDVDPMAISTVNKLRTFIPAAIKAALVTAVHDRFDKIPENTLFNALFDVVSTVGDLVDFVMEAENNA